MRRAPRGGNPRRSPIVRSNELFGLGCALRSYAGHARSLRAGSAAVYAAAVSLTTRSGILLLFGEERLLAGLFAHVVRQLVIERLEGLPLDARDVATAVAESIRDVHELL